MHYCKSAVLSAKYYTKSIISMAIVERERPLEGGFQTLLMKPEEIHTTVSFDEFLSGFKVNSLHTVLIIKSFDIYQKSLLNIKYMLNSSSC